MELVVQSIGWIGNLLFALCAVPQVIKTHQEGHSKGLSWGFILMWSVGELLAGIYGYLTEVPLPILLNYLFNFICLLIILSYKLNPRKEIDDA
jgi:uncharacterized protein with PQ loop repeat